MAAKKTKSSRISAEEKRLRKTYANLPTDRLTVADGLIRRAAYMRIALEDYESDLDAGGYVEMFCQSVTTPPYERERPVARLYNSLGKNYQTIIKQLTDLLPKTQEVATDDGFDSFVGGRD